MAVLSTDVVIKLALTEDQVQRVDHPAYRPIMATTLTLTYRDGVPDGAELTGKQIRNNGELSKSQGTMRFWLGGDVLPDRVPPAWVADLAEQYRPGSPRPAALIRECIRTLQAAAEDHRNGKTFRVICDARAEQLKWALGEPSMFDENDDDDEGEAR